MSVILLVGDRHSGKTSTCRRLAELLRARGASVGGIVAPAIHEADRCVGYDVVDLMTGHSARLAALDGPGVEQVGRFHFLADGLALGRAALDNAAESCPRLVIVDEVGPLELAGRGWAAHLDQLAGRPGFTLFTVRRNLAGQVAGRWKAAPQASQDLAWGPDAAIDALISLIETSGMQDKRFPPAQQGSGQ
jgi:nucleoside-triphosphatase THEP1